MIIGPPCRISVFGPEGPRTNPFFFISFVLRPHDSFAAGEDPPLGRPFPLRRKVPVIHCCLLPFFPCLPCIPWTSPTVAPRTIAVRRFALLPHDFFAAFCLFFVPSVYFVDRFGLPS